MVTEPKIAYVILHVIAVCGCKGTILELSMGAVTECTKCKQKWRIKAVSYTPTTLDAVVEPVSDLVIGG